MVSFNFHHDLSDVSGTHGSYKVVLNLISDIAIQYGFGANDDAHRLAAISELVVHQCLGENAMDMDVWCISRPLPRYHCGIDKKDRSKSTIHVAPTLPRFHSRWPPNRIEVVSGLDGHSVSAYECNGAIYCTGATDKIVLIIRVATYRYSFLSCFPIGASLVTCWYCEPLNV